MKLRNFFEKHKFLISVCLITFFVAIAELGLLYNKIAQGLLVWWMAVLLIGSIFLIPIFALIIRKHWLSLQVLTVLMLAVLGVLYLFVFTPNSVPDEPIHYRTAYHLSNKMMFDFGDQDSALNMRQEDVMYMEKTPTMLSSRHYNQVSKDNYLFCKNKEVITTAYGYMENKTLVYIPAATGITLGRLIGLSGYWTYQLGRLFNFIMFAVFIFFAIKLMPFGKIAVSAISLIPMNMHIMASFSYDAFTTGGVILLFAYIMHLMYDDKKIGFKALSILAIMIALIIPQKVVYIGVAALVLLLPKEKFKLPKWHFAFKCLLGLCAVGGIFILQLNNAPKLVSDSVSYSPDTAGYSMQYIFTHLPEIVVMLFRTLCNKTEFYLKSMVAFFGWFQIDTPWYLVMPVFFFVALSFMRKSDEPEPLPFTEKLYSIILFLAVFLLIELLLLIDHTPFGSLNIEGVQGRYFIPALPLIFLAIRNNLITVSKNIDDVIMIGMPTLNIIIIVFCVVRVLML